VGGLLFTWIESTAVKQRDADLRQLHFDCIVQVTLSCSNFISFQKLASNDPNVINGGAIVNKTAFEIADCFKQEEDIRSRWGYVTGTLYGFGIVTTLGYNRIAPITTHARLLCVFYGLLGIPVTMIIIANLGQYFNGFASVVKKKAVHFKVNFRLDFFAYPTLY
jgi:hypothetical protein